MNAYKNVALQSMMAFSRAYMPLPMPNQFPDLSIYPNLYENVTGSSFTIQHPQTKLNFCLNPCGVTKQLRE